MHTSKPPAQHPVRDSWPPTQMFLQPRHERDDAEIEDLDLAGMNEDPIVYFLTPTPSSYGDDEAMEFDMEFDAGIEDAKHPPQIVRSVSPSSLAGLSLPPPRPPTPPKSPATPDLEYDLSATPDDHEQYDYMEASWPPRAANALSLPRRLKERFKGQPKHDAAVGAERLVPLAPAPAHPAPSSSSSSRGRAATRPGPMPTPTASGSKSRARRSRGTPARLSPHAWREPSPDVWSIEEEPEKELHSEMEESGVMEALVGRAVDIPAAKPKKKVRFVLPVSDDGRSAGH